MKSRRYVFSRKLTRVGVLLSALCLGLLAYAQSRETDQATGPPDYDLSWFTIDGGGVMFSTSRDGEHELSGTIGQPDASGPMAGPAGPGYELTGGFWYAQVPGDCVVDGVVNLFDYDVFEACLSGPGGGRVSSECGCYDLDGDNDVDLSDFDLFQSGFSG